ncbi:hypothetical protein [Gemmata massiliana]|uniref:hypothetical protein n=1 Tax=Gemmata massiliana TaxID=1210884 RepID=UPI0018D6ED23|nr:hypothetical protein [Gemmata massiliana]
MHTMLLGTLCILLGHQTLWLGLFGKLYGTLVATLPTDPIAGRLIEWLSVERTLILGAIAFLCGAGMNLWLVKEWWDVALGELELRHTLRHALWGLTEMVVGVQTAYGGLFLGLLQQLRAPVGTPSAQKEPAASTST